MSTTSTMSPAELPPLPVLVTVVLWVLEAPPTETDAPAAPVVSEPLAVTTLEPEPSTPVETPLMVVPPLPDTSAPLVDAVLPAPVVDAMPAPAPPAEVVLEPLPAT